MIRQVIRYILFFVFLVLLQVVILNNINFGGSINPYLYIAFILALPLNTKKAWVLILGFIMGLTIDLFVYTPGINTAATVFLAFARNAILPYLEPRDGFDPASRPSVSDYGWSWYLRYILFLVPIHHLALFLLDSFSIKDFGHTLFDSLASMAFTFVLIIFTQTSYSGRKPARE